MKYLEKFLVDNWDFLGTSEGKESACDAGNQGLIPGLENPLEEAWRIPRMEEPCGLQSMGLQSPTRLSD